MIRLTVRILIAGLIAAAIWWLGPLIAIGVYRPLGWLLLRQILVGLCLAWGLWPLLVRIWVWAAMGTRQVRLPSRAPTLDAISARLRDLDRQLKQRWHRAQRPGLRRWWGSLRGLHREALPWFMVVGEHGAGKSTLIRQALSSSALQRSGASASVRSAGSGGDLDFWIADDRVWIDTKGDWPLLDDPDSGGGKAWRQLLQGIQRMRGRPLVNGLVLCLDAAVIMNSTAEQRAIRIDQWRRCLREFREQSGHLAQVYLCLTHLDELDGAVTFLSLLRHEAWGGGMGFVLDTDLRTLAPSAQEDRLRAQLTAFEDRVQQQVLHAAPLCAQPSSNVDQLRFVESMAALRDPLLAMLLGLVLTPDDEALCQLRGVWWGSVADLVDDDQLAQGAQASADAQRFNLGLLWSPVLRQLSAEKHLASGERTVGMRQRMWSVAQWGAVLTCGCLVMAWLGWGYWAERNRLEQVWARFNESKRLAQDSQGQADGRNSALMAVAEQMSYARSHAEDTSGLLPTAFQEHRRVADIADQTYRRHLQKTFMPELHNQVLQVLQAQVQGSPGDIYQTLKIHLMMGKPEQRQAAELERWLGSRWEAISGGQYSEADKATLNAHARAAFTLADMPGTPLDASLIQQSRALAAQIPTVTRVLQHIRDQGLPPQVAEVNLSRAAGLSAAMTLRLRSNLPATDPVVPGWYTRAGFLDVFLPRLTPSARAVMTEESWVLRDERLTGNTFEIDKAVQKLADATRVQFLEDYIRHWQKFVEDVTVRTFTGLEDAAQLASTFIDPQSPLALLIRFVGRETTLTGNYDGDVDSWIDKQKHNIEKAKRSVVGELAGEHYRAKLLPEHKVEDHFDALRRLGTQLTQSATSSGNNPMARLFEPLYRQLGLVNGALQAGQVLPEYDAFSRMRSEASRQPEPVRGVMLDLINNGSSMTSKRSTAMISRGAAAPTLVACEQGLVDRFPFRRGARSEASVVDVERLFGPQGSMATYFKENLAAHVDTGATPWRSRRAESGGSPLVSAEVIRAYESAERIRHGMLDDSGRLRVSTVLRFVDMDPQIAEAQIDLGGQIMRYTHGSSSPKRVDWPAQGGQMQIRLSLRTVDGRTDSLQFDGPWALMRFFESGRVAGGSADRRESLHQMNVGSVRMEWQAVSLPSPIWSELLSTFRCPR